MHFWPSVWMPIVATLVLLTIVTFWPLPAQSGDYDFGPAFAMIFHLVVAIVGLLSIWLIFFIVFALHV